MKVKKNYKKRPAKSVINKYLSILLSVFLSVLTWIILNIYQNPTDNSGYKYSLELKNKEYLSENDLILNNESDLSNLEVVLTVQGRQEDLERLNKQDFNVSIDFSNVESAGDKELKIDIESFNVIGNNVKVSCAPDKVNIDLENIIPVTVDVISSITGEVKEGYQLTDISLSQSEYTFIGAESEVGTYSYLEAQIDVTDLSGDEVKPVVCKLYNQAGEVIKPAGNGVSVTAALEISKKVSVVADVIGNVEEYFYVDSITVMPETVLLHGPPMILEPIESLSSESVDIDGATNDINVRRRIIVPDSASLNQSSTTEVDIEIKILRFASQEFTLSSKNVDILNRSASMRYELMKNEIKFILIGKASDLRNLDVNDVIASVSVEGLGEGVHNVLLKISPPNLFRVYGTDSVDVNVIYVPPGRNPVTSTTKTTVTEPVSEQEPTGVGGEVTTLPGDGVEPVSEPSVEGGGTGEGGAIGQGSGNEPTTETTSGVEPSPGTE
jgi:YbbR domain-containing protein